MKLKVTARQFKMLLDNIHWLRKGVGLSIKSSLLKKFLDRKEEGV